MSRDAIEALFVIGMVLLPFVAAAIALMYWGWRGMDGRQ